MEKNICHDCGKKLQKGDEYIVYEVVEKKFVKCKACHKKDPKLKNFQKAEVYSRVVGYIRPVEQWNKGKQAEFGDRKEYCVDCKPKKKAAKNTIKPARPGKKATKSVRPGKK